MEIIKGLSAPATRAPTVITIGQFDGVHLGHQAQLRRVAELAAAEAARAVAVTYWPLPPRADRQGERVSMLTTYEQKVDLLARLGVLDALVVVPATTEGEQLPPEDLLARLREHFEIRAVVEGPDCAVGDHGVGDLDWLRSAGERGGFAVEVVEVERDGALITSSRIRELLAAGGVETATHLLGRPYTMEGMVARGDQRGRLLGFPTANLKLDPVRLVPANGVYAVRVGLADEREPLRPGVANVGVRPTFGPDNARLVEVHILDAALDLYDQPLRVAFVVRLREERRFDGLDALKAQIAADAAQARTLLAESRNASETDAQGRGVGH